MGKGKNAALILLAALFIAACGLLPGAIAAYQDRMTLGQPRFEEVQTVHLDIREAEVLPPIEGLAMMARLDQLIVISESMASMTQKEVEERARSVLQSYVDAGLVEPFEPEFYDVHCVLAQLVSDPSMTQILWILTMVTPPDVPYASMGLAIADASGQVLTVDYAGDRAIDLEERKSILPVFANLFFGSLSLPNYADFATNDLKKMTAAVRYRFENTICGEIHVDLYVYEYGFYTEFHLPVEGSR